tara:strand:- start:140839 stop:141126 length:288 start_codon:yes stop_codon:yes gene_type:complete
MTNTLKQQWSAIPDHVRTDFAPRVKQGMMDFWALATQSTDEDWSEEKMKTAGDNLIQKGAALCAEFKAAGGTEAHWSTITRVINTGKYDSFKAKP